MNLSRIIALTLATAAVLLSGTAFAQSTATSTFNVNLTLTPKCYVNMTGTPPADGATTDVTLSYTAFQSTHAEGSTGFTVTCTNSLGYGIAVTNDTNTVAGVNYYLRLASGTTASYTSTTGQAALTALAGTGAAQDYTIGVRAPSGQAGTCAGPGTCSGSNLHTITVTY